MAKNAGIRRKRRGDRQVEGWVGRLEEIQDGVELVGLRARRLTAIIAESVGVKSEKSP